MSEEEEENKSESSAEADVAVRKKAKQSAPYSIGHLTKNIWRNKIYSNDYDVDSEMLRRKKRTLGQPLDSAILEDNEYSEMENPYFSDNSSAS